MAAILREWRGLQRRCHRALLAALRGSSSDAMDSQNAAPAYAHRSDRKQPWLSALYGFIIASKRSREMTSAARISAPSVPVISAGNVTFGATGKTPCVTLLTEIALQYSRERRQDKVPMLLTRGYGDDEWRFFQSAFPECKLAIGADRLRVGTEKASENGAQLSCIVLDDGLQQWRIRKDLEVVMIDALHPFGNGHLIPHGSLRERPRDALARADVIVIHHANLLRSRSTLNALKASLRMCTHSSEDRRPVIATSQMRVKRLVRASDMLAHGSNAPDDEDDDDNELKDSVALIVCGVGNPESVELVVRAMSCWQQVQMEAFPDHHSFSHVDICDLQLLVEQTRNKTQRKVVVVTTEKDFFRVPQLMAELAQSCDLRVLQCQLELLENAELVRQRVHDLLDYKDFTFPAITKANSMSSFRRKTPAATGAAAVPGAPVASTFAPAPRRQLGGTKPFLNGQTLLSSGLAQLDAILGGGLLLGTLVLLETPRSDAGGASVALVNDVHRYFAGEGVVSGQCAMLIAQDAAGFAQHQLPLELSLAQKQVKQQLASLGVASKQQQQKSGEAQAEQDDAKLTIAWQYGKYLSTDGPQQQQQRFCHSFDLSRPIHRELLEANPPVLVDALSLGTPSPQATYDRLLLKIEAEIKARTGQAVLRVSMLELGSPVFGTADGAHMTALSAFVRKLRALVSSQPVVCVLSGPLFAFPVEFDNEIRHHCDYVLELKSFMGENDMLPAELSEFHGLMDICKLARVHSLASHSVDAMKYGVKRERRKLKIEKFHLPPEGSRSSSNSNSNNSDSTSSTSKSNLVGSSFTTKSKSASCGGGSSSSGFDPLAF